MIAETTLPGRHVLLEPLRIEHAEALSAAIAPDDDVFHWTNTAPRTPVEMAAWIQGRRSPPAGVANLPFLMRQPVSRAAMGSTSIFAIDLAAESAEIGHTWIAAPYRRTGVNTEAKRLMLGHCFDVLGLQRVQLVTDLRNERSQRAIERIGATREGVLRSWRRDLSGALRNSVVYSVLRSEWPDVRERLDGMLR